MTGYSESLRLRSDGCSVSLRKVITVNNYGINKTLRNQGRGTRANISNAKIYNMRLKGMRLSGQRPNGMWPNGMRSGGMRLKGRGSRERGLSECGPTEWIRKCVGLLVNIISVQIKIEPYHC